MQRVWLPSPNYSSRGGSGVRLVVLHTAEGARTFADLGAFFASSSSGVSSHVGIDDTPGVIGEYVRPEHKAWTQGNANPYSIAAELCAFAAWDLAEWDRHPAMLINAAEWVAEECRRYTIPVRRLTAAQAQGGEAGVCQHVDLGAAGGGHWDCGPGFPMGDVVAMAATGEPAHAAPDDESEEAIVVSVVIKHRGQLSCAQASAGQLWHKFSHDGGLTWRTEPLIRPSGEPVTATVKDTVSISTVDGTLFISTEDQSNRAWICRQSGDISTGWDIRSLP